MRLTNINTNRVVWGSEFHPNDFANISHDSHALCECTGVHQCMDIAESRKLNEATYKELATMVDGNFLNQKVRADVLNGIKLDRFEDNTVHFIINSSEFDSNRIQYQCSVKFDDWDDIAQDNSFNFSEKARMLLWVGNIRLHCTCPSYSYHGYQYLLSVLDASIYPETRSPKKTNPDQRGIVCKHLNRILRVLPFYSGDIAAELKRQYAA